MPQAGKRVCLASLLGRQHPLPSEEERTLWADALPIGPRCSPDRLDDGPVESIVGGDTDAPDVDAHGAPQSDPRFRGVLEGVGQRFTTRPAAHRVVNSQVNRFGNELDRTIHHTGRDAARMKAVEAA